MERIRLCRATPTGFGMRRLSCRMRREEGSRHAHTSTHFAWENAAGPIRVIFLPPQENDNRRDAMTRTGKGSLNRRTLFRYGAAGGAWIAVSGIRPPAAAASESTAVPEPSAASFDLEEATFSDLRSRMESGAETARSIATKFLARIDALDRRGPELRSVLE